MSAHSPPVQMARSAGAARSIPLSSPSASAPVRPLMKGGTGVGVAVFVFVHYSSPLEGGSQDINSTKYFVPSTWY